MASKSKIEKQKRNAKLVAKYAEKRKALIEEGDYEALRKLPRSSSATRLRRLCQLTGRPRAVYRKFKISRIALRDMAHEGVIPGLKKSSW